MIWIEDCIFCKIIKREIPAAVVYEDDDVLAFLDIMPANKGHTLVVPKKHHETLLDLPDSLAEAVIVGVRKVSEAVVRSQKAEGFNIQLNNKPAAGQEVPHLHFHVVPRFESDGLRAGFGRHLKYEEGEMDEMAEKIKAAL